MYRGTDKKACTREVTMGKYKRYLQVESKDIGCHGDLGVKGEEESKDTPGLTPLDEW